MNGSQILYHFFLGGYDAEMCEIRRILEELNLSFSDRRLKWGARASAYQSEIRSLKQEIPVLIELEVDIALPKKAILIDHHGSTAGKTKLTSIEQIAQLLDIPLTRWQRLIAANDRGWIDGLLEAGATKEEIAKIRAYDRQCQGVSAKEEEAAERAIRKIEKHGPVILVRYPYKNTSPVMDRLYGKFQNILVVTPESINFSGEGKCVLRLAEAFPGGWYGGNLPEKGFWGMEGVKNLEEIISLLKDIK